MSSKFAATKPKTLKLSKIAYLSLYFLVMWYHEFFENSAKQKIWGRPFMNMVL